MLGEVVPAVAARVARIGVQGNWRWECQGQGFWVDENRGAISVFPGHIHCVVMNTSCCVAFLPPTLGLGQKSRDSKPRSFSKP